MTRRDLIVQYLDTLAYDDIDTLITIHNEYCDYTRDNNTIYRMSALDELTCGMSTSETLRNLADDFSIDDDYFYVNGYGHFCSFTDAVDSPISTDDIADESNREEEDFDSLTIREILNALDPCADYTRHEIEEILLA